MRFFVGGLTVLVCVLCLTCTGSALDDVSQAYARIKPALVKVWAFDAHGLPVDTGTGFVVKSDAQQSWIVTARHVVAGAGSVRIDYNRQLHDVQATVVAQSSDQRDVALLLISRGNFHAAQFVATGFTATEGAYVATAGYFQNDEQIGVAEQLPSLVGPGTIASLPNEGRLIHVNLGVEPGLSGAPVFDIATGNVVGVMDTRSSLGRGGYAISARLVVQEFLTDNTALSASTPAPARTPPVAATAPPAIIAVATPQPTPAPSTPRPAAIIALVATPTPGPAPTPVRVAAPAPSTPPPALVALAPVPTPGIVQSADVDVCFGRTPAHLDSVIASCTNLIAAGAPNRLLYDRRAYAYRQNREYDLAIADCDRALQLDPDDEEAYQNRASSHNGKKQWELAVADATKALEIDSNLAPAYRARGRAYENLALRPLRFTLPEALNDYDKAVSLDANQSFYIQRFSNAFYNRLTLPPHLGTAPPGFSAASEPFDGFWFGGCRFNGHVLLYNDYSVTMYFNFYIQPVQTASDRDFVRSTYVGRFGLAPGETKDVPVNACNAPRRGYWLRDIRFGTDKGPLLFPSQNALN